MFKSDIFNQQLVVCCDAIGMKELGELLARFGMQLVEVAADQEIEGSFWGESEAGLVGNQLLVRLDTPIHSALHEACHYICMDDERRRKLHTDAGGTFIEEDGVCYLQIILSDYLPNMNRAQMLSDMDTWGYSFRLGSSRAWFEQDAEDALEWLQTHQLLDAEQVPLWQVRH